MNDYGRDLKTEWIGAKEAGLESSFVISVSGILDAIENISPAVCLYCHNRLVFDKRGGCISCGAPNGGRTEN